MNDFSFAPLLAGEKSNEAYGKPEVIHGQYLSIFDYVVIAVVLISKAETIELSLDAIGCPRPKRSQRMGFTWASLSETRNSATIVAMSVSERLTYVIALGIDRDKVREWSTGCAYGLRILSPR